MISSYFCPCAGSLWTKFMYATISFSRAVKTLKKGPPPHFSMDILRSEGLTSKYVRARLQKDEHAVALHQTCFGNGACKNVWRRGKDREENTHCCRGGRRGPGKVCKNRNTLQENWVWLACWGNGLWIWKRPMAVPGPMPNWHVASNKNSNWRWGAIFLTLQSDSLSGTTNTRQRSETTQAFQKSKSACYPPNCHVPKLQSLRNDLSWISGCMQVDAWTLPHHYFQPSDKILLHDVFVQGWPQNLIICSAPLLGPFAFATSIFNWQMDLLHGILP